MAGRGPRPKDANRRARADSSGIEPTILRFEQAEQPPLPDDVPWPDRTREWWDMWRDAPQAEYFSVTDWDFLLDTALIHADFWAGNLACEGALRLRVAKFGATMEDRARLRMQFAEADAADEKRDKKPAARDRYNGLRAVN